MKDIRINQMYFQVLPCQSKDGDVWQMIQDKTWDSETFDFFKNYISPDKKFIDIGGWIGTTTLEAYAYNPKHIYSIEADPANYQTLKHNLSINYMFDKVSAFNACLTDKDNAKRITMFGTANKEKPNSSSHRIDNGNRIPVITVDDWKFLKRNCDLDNVNCINADIEGSERYLCETLYKLQGSKVILMSFHPPYWGDDKEQVTKDVMNSIERYTIIDPFNYQVISKNILQERLMDKSVCRKIPSLKGQFFPVILQKTR